jgi:hypothetical protein
MIENKNGKYVYGLYLKISGRVNGSIEIEFMNGERTFFRRIPFETGKIYFVYDADWYSNDIILKIISDNNINGHINIEYKFKTTEKYDKIVDVISFSSLSSLVSETS